MFSAASIDVSAIRDAARRSDVIAAMGRFYEDADRRIAAMPATCWNKGDCCRFGQFGHRLYVTTLEAAYYLATQSESDAAPLSRQSSLPIVNSLAKDTCPHAYDGACHARIRRPLGCRIFYCDPAAQHWQGPLTEELLQDLRDMHVDFGVPYQYADWMDVLRRLDE